MSTTTGTLQTGRGIDGRRMFVAIAVALVVGAGIGGAVTSAVIDDATTPAAGAETAPAVQPAAWDPQKLDAMGKRQDAEPAIREATGQG